MFSFRTVRGNQWHINRINYLFFHSILVFQGKIMITFYITSIRLPIIYIGLFLIAINVCSAEQVISENLQDGTSTYKNPCAGLRSGLILWIKIWTLS